MQIGSPLPEHKNLIAQQLIEGQIEFLNKQQDLHNQSNVVLRSVKDIGIDALNGTWVYTPQYMYDNRHPISYTLGHMLEPMAGGYCELLATLTQKAEHEMYFGPLIVIRKFLIRHDSVSGKTDLRMPDDWAVRIDDDLKMRDFMGVIEGYVTSTQRQEIASVVFEKYYATGVSTEDLPVRLLFSDGRLTLVDTERKIPGADLLFDMTPIVRFISRPYDHGLTQKSFRAYRSLVNL